MRERCGRILATLWALLLNATGILFLVHCLKRPRLLVLAYHRVTPADAKPQWTDPERFVAAESLEKQLRALRRFYRFVSLSDFRALVTGKKRLRGHVVLVTFDDGYREQVEHALPVLQGLGVPAAFFLSLGFVGERRSFWFDRLAETLRAWERDAADRERLRAFLPAPLRDIFASSAPLPARLHRAVDFLARLPLRERRALMKRVLPEPRGTPPALDWKQARRLLDLGMELGAHGRTHTALTRLSEQDARQELHDSLAGVTRGSGAPVFAVAYPHGEVDAGVAAWAREAGAELGFTLEARPNRPGQDPLRLGRVSVCEDTSRSCFGGFSAALFRARLTGLIGRAGARPERRTRLAEAHLDLSWTGPLEVSPRSRQPSQPAARVAADTLLPPDPPSAAHHAASPGPLHP